MVTGFGLITPQCGWPLGFLERYPVSTIPLEIASCLTGRFLETPGWKSLGHSEVGVRAQGLVLLWEVLASCRSSLNVWHPSMSRPCTEWMSGFYCEESIMRTVLPKRTRHHITSACYHWSECTLRKLNVTQTQDIFGNCMISSNFVWIFIQALFY